MPRIGAHMSIAGGLPFAVERARAHGCETLQIFTRSASQWRARKLPQEEIASFRRLVAASEVQPVFAHDSYLINLATSNPELRDRSMAAFSEEIDRAEGLGLMGVVMHPGSCTDGSEESGLSRIADALASILRERRKGRVMVLLEHTAGQGTSLGHRFEHLAWIIDRLGGSNRIGVCLDTCHLVASGYDIATAAGYRRTFADFDRIVGLDRLRLFHLNDSKKPCASRVDRHEHIGKGCLGPATFRRLLRDRRFSGLPMIIETPKSHARARGAVEIDPFDSMNLAELRRLRGTVGPPARKSIAIRPVRARVRQRPVPGI
jgi:deoxyribonuclease IV